MNKTVKEFLRNGYHWHELLGSVIGIVFAFIAYSVLSFHDIHIIWRSIITFCIGFAAGFVWEVYRAEFKGKPFDWYDVLHSGLGAFFGFWILSIWYH